MSKKLTLRNLLSMYNFTVDYDKPFDVECVEGDLLLNLDGRVNKDDYQYVIRKATDTNDLIIYHIPKDSKYKNTGFKASPLTKPTKLISAIKSHIKNLV